MSFVQALIALQYRPIPLSGGPGEKVVAIGIQRTLDAMFMNLQFADLASKGLKFFDLETTVGAFNVVLSRVRVIPLDEFDPVAFL